MIRAPAGRFDFEEYAQLEHVVEGYLVSYADDSLTVRVDHVWSGTSELGDRLTFYRNFRVNLEEDQLGLFMADSLGRLSIFGIARDGFYYMVGRSSPNILTEDDLHALSSGETPEFNQHQSAITVHFPLSDEEIPIFVFPSGADRITESEYDRWNGMKAFGTLFNGRNDLTEFAMYQLDMPISLAGDVRSYDDGVYHIDLWPKYPAFASIESMEDFFENGSIPVYSFRVIPDNPDNWSIGLPDQAFLLADGNEFYLTGRQRLVDRSYYQRGTDNQEMQFPTFSSGGSGSSRATQLRIEGLDTAVRKPLLMNIIEAARNGRLHASLLFVESSDIEPVFFSGCEIKLDSPSYLIRSTGEYSTEMDLDGSILSFTETGQTILEVDGSIYTQLNADPVPFGFQLHNSVFFEHPNIDTVALLLHFSSISSYSNHYGTSDYLIARMLDNYYQNDSIDVTAYTVSISKTEFWDSASFTMQLR